MKIKTFLALLVFFSTMTLAQSGVTNEAAHATRVGNNFPCVLSTASNGQMVTVRGKVQNTPHDLAFDIADCSITVLLTFAGDTDNDVSGSELHCDKKLKVFQKYTREVHKGTGKNICIGCAKYGDVEAELTGILEVASLPTGATKDSLGRIRDKDGKFIGRFGWAIQFLILATVS